MKRIEKRLNGILENWKVENQKFYEDYKDLLDKLFTKLKTELLQ